MANIVTTLFSDSAKTNALYPRTKTSAVSDNDGNTLGNIAVWNALDVASGVDTVKVGLDMDLLWTNASPTSSFSAQTIPIDLSNYGILFICYYSNYNQNPKPQRGVSVALKSYGYGTLVDGSNLWPRRNVVVTNTGVQFTDAVANGSTQNGYCVPQYIYGVK